MFAQGFAGYFIKKVRSVLPEFPGSVWVVSSKNGFSGNFPLVDVRIQVIYFVHQIQILYGHVAEMALNWLLTISYIRDTFP
jgi:hypothetical protein